LSSSCGTYDVNDKKQFESKETITLAISTSRRLKHFLQTIVALENSIGKLPNSLVTRVILVDDNSSEEDRNIMKNKYPNFEFHFKLPNEKGHANTMNKIFSLVDSQYLLYLEDDWRIFDVPVVVDSLKSALLAINSSTGNNNLLHHPFQSILMASIAILKQGNIQQILFNSQSTRDCASGANCNIDTMKSGGWERSVFYDNNTNIPYSLHEFGIASSLPDSHKLVQYGDRTHDFALWPGLTLNPGLWNIAVIKKMLSSCLDNQDRKLFDENDKLFEHRFSSLGYAAGITIGYFQSLIFEHIGDVSAYSINDNERPWDNNKK
jgi:glycosyltransferase involved in cell wall biosynthesis